MRNNILITSAGQRVTLVEIFKNTAQVLRTNSKVYTADMNPLLAPAGYVSEHCFKVSRCTTPEYIEQLINICKENNIGIIIPTIDTELANLAKHKYEFNKNEINVIISDEDFISTCRDKRKTALLFNKLNIDIPKSIDKFNPTFPMFAKPYDGSLSTNIHIIKNKDELTNEILEDPKLLFMEYIDKKEFKEFTVDMYYGRDNHVKGIIPRERIKIREGEINKGITRKNYIVKYLKERMDFMPGVIGTICLQLFYREKDHKIYGIEINPRFGGGYPLSYYAKANFAEYICKEYLLGQEVEYNENWTDNTLMLRYDKDVIVQL